MLQLFVYFSAPSQNYAIPGACRNILCALLSLFALSRQITMLGKHPVTITLEKEIRDENLIKSGMCRNGEFCKRNVFFRVIVTRMLNLEFSFLVCTHGTQRILHSHSYTRTNTQTLYNRCYFVFHSLKCLYSKF